MTDETDTKPAPAPKTPAQKQRQILKESEADIVKLCEGLAAVHASIAAMAARADAADMPRNALLAATLYAVANVPAPPAVASKDPNGLPIILPIRTAVWTQQFIGEGAAVARADRIQRLLNNGQPLDIPGVSPETVAQELLAGKDPRRLAPKAPAPIAPVPAEAHKDLAGWYGFRGSNKSVAPQPDTNVR